MTATQTLARGLLGTALVLAPLAASAEQYTASTWFAPTHLLSHYPYMERHEADAKATVEAMRRLMGDDPG